MAEEKTVVVQSGFGVGALCLAFLGGAAVGAVVALLNAKESGPELRERLDERREKLLSASTGILSAAEKAGLAAKSAFQDAYQEARAQPEKKA